MSETPEKYRSMLDVHMMRLHESFSNNQWPDRFYLAEVTKAAARRITELEAKVAVMDKKLNPCKTCGGSGKLDDADFGDISYNEWPCPDCASSS